MSTPPTLIITGASRGLGAAIARHAAQLGAAVVLTARSEADLRALAEAITADGGTAWAIPADVTDAQDCARLVQQTLDRAGRLDGLVNNAGVIDPIARLEDVDIAAWETLLRVNVTGPLRLIQAALPALRQTNGRVINVSSGAAIKARAGWGAYCASKAALNMLNSTLALEEPAITALAVRPGAVDTPMQGVIREAGEAAMSETDYTRFVGLHKTGELLPPDAPGRAIAVLACYAPPAWSGAFIQWTDERVTALVEAHAPHA